jgi:hypothetical protein
MLAYDIDFLKDDKAGMEHEAAQARARACEQCLILLVIKPTTWARLSVGFGPQHWQRFIAVQPYPGEILVIDRYVHEGSGQFALKMGKQISTGRLFQMVDRVFFRPDDVNDPDISANHIIGKVIQTQRTPPEYPLA